METITKYKAIDGKEFVNEKDCLDYEDLIKRVNSIMKDLYPLPQNDGCEFSNGKGFIQHDLSTIKKVKLSLLNEIEKYIDHKWVQQTKNDESAHPSFVDRLLDDYSIAPLQEAWYRIYCIDNLGREFGQPYYTSNPEKAELVCINK